MRLVFMGTPDFAVPSLFEINNAGFEIAAVVTQPDRPKGRGQKVLSTPVKAAAQELGLPVLQPDSVKTTAFLEEMREVQPEAIVVVAFGQILPASLLDLPPKGCINLHASLLPYYRGAAPIHWAVIDGAKETGVTTMYMDKGMDTGDMILSERVAIENEDTAGSIHDKLAASGANLLVRTLNLVTSGLAPRQPQDHNQATYAPMILREHELIDWQKTAKVLVNQVRGMDPWPGAYTFWQGKILKIWRATLPDTKFSAQDFNKADKEHVEPGQILSILPEGMIVLTGDGMLLIKELQIQGSRRMNVSDFLRGNHIALGTRLGGETP